jgi:hypothetical protein
MGLVDKDCMKQKRIFIIDEHGFSKICSTLLQFEGLSAESFNPDIGAVPLFREHGRPGLVITSYPRCHGFLNDLKKSGIPCVILVDCINGEVLRALEGAVNSYCMVKPIDYHKFRSIVRGVLDGGMRMEEGYAVV